MSGPAAFAHLCLFDALFMNRHPASCTSNARHPRPALQRPPGRPTHRHSFPLHGWMGFVASFQFLVEALRQEWHVIAPDWRGLRPIEWLGRPYLVPRLLATWMRSCGTTPDRAARWSATVSGANIAPIYASARPARVAQVAMLDSLGLMAPRLKTRRSSWGNGWTICRARRNCAATRTMPACNGACNR